MPNLLKTSLTTASLLVAFALIWFSPKALAGTYGSSSYSNSAYSSGGALTTTAQAASKAPDNTKKNVEKALLGFGVVILSIAGFVGGHKN